MAIVLRTLHEQTGNYGLLKNLAKKESSKLEIFSQPTACTKQTESQSCPNALQLLSHCQPSLLKAFNPLHVIGDGNCLFRAVSLSLYNSEDHHVELRLRCAIEAILNREFYDLSLADCQCSLKSDVRLVLPAYNDFISELTENGAYSDMLTVFCLSSVMKQPIQMYYPPLAPSFDISPFTRLVKGRDQLESHQAKVVIMWSTVFFDRSMALNTVIINHFVALMHRSMVGKVDVVNIYNISTISNEDDRSIFDKHETESALNRPNMRKFICNSPELINYQNSINNRNLSKDRNNSPGNSIKNLENDDIPNTNCQTNFLKRRLFNAQNDCAEKDKNIGTVRNKFMSFIAIHDILSNSKSTSLPEVPRGPKTNQYYVVDNSLNAKMNLINKPNRFWDDCGTWDSKQGRNLTSVFKRVDDTLLYVQVVNANICIRRRVNKKVIMVQLDPQPVEKDIVSIQSIIPL